MAIMRRVSASRTWQPVRICAVLAATPNDLLLPEGKPPAQSGRDHLLARITIATDSLSLAELELAACQIECLMVHRPARATASAKKGGDRVRLETIAKLATLLEVKPAELVSMPVRDAKPNG
jgi:DNA-binding Xre family transcriptional regulator